MSLHHLSTVCHFQSDETSSVAWRFTKNRWFATWFATWFPTIAPAERNNLVKAWHLLCVKKKKSHNQTAIKGVEDFYPPLYHLYCFSVIWSFSPYFLPPFFQTWCQLFVFKGGCLIIAEQKSVFVILQTGTKSKENVNRCVTLLSASNFPYTLRTWRNPWYDFQWL